MAQLRLAGLRTAADAPLVRERRLPVAGDVLVSTGQRVEADALLGRDRSEQNLHVLRLDTEQQQIQATLLKQAGDPVKRGEPVAYQTYLFGLGYREYVAPVDGTVVDIQPSNGFVVIRERPEDVALLLSGRVVRVLPGEAAWLCCRGGLVEGVHGTGGATTGRLLVRDETADGPRPITPDMIDAGVAGRIVAGRGWVEEGALIQCLRWRARALVCGSIERAVLRRFEAYTAGLTREELEARFYTPAAGGEAAAGGGVPAEDGSGSAAARLVVVVTDGFGRLPMRQAAWALLRAADGRPAYAAAPDPLQRTRAEVIIPEGEPPNGPDAAAAPGAGPGPGTAWEELVRAGDEGSRVRVVAGAALGREGRVVNPEAQLSLETGQTVPATVVELDGGGTVTVPRQNLERLWEGA